MIIILVIEKRMLNQKKGNILLVVVCLIVTLMISLVYLLKSTTNRTFTVKKIENTLYARELAYTLASLSVHYLKNKIRNRDSGIIELISLPIETMANDSGEKNLLNIIENLTMANDGSKVIDLIKNKSGLNQLTIDKLYWKILKKDFTYITIGKSKPYTREKNGLIHIYVELSYLLPGSKSTEKTKEIHHFITDLKVVANLLPVLSKFTLYIDDALDGDSSDVERFNVVDTDPNGNLNNENYKPWILNNHDKLDAVDTNLKTYNDIVNSTKGLVFIGGGSSQEGKAIRLGIAFGEVDSRSPYGEGFHFFCNEESGYWKTQTNWAEGVGLLTSNLGLCHELEQESTYGVEEEGEDDSYNTYFEMTDGEDKDKLNSIFKLYGTDQNPSPTLVLGYVDAKYCSVKQFRFGTNDEDYDLLNYVTREDFNYASSYDYNSYEEAFEAHQDDEDDFDDDLTEFAFKYREHYSSKLEYDTYYDKFSSRIESIPYNNDYAYALNHFIDDPFKNKIVKGNKFKKLCRQRSSSLFTKVPSSDYAKFDKILLEDKLGDLNKFLDVDKLQINGNEKSNNNKRISYYLQLTSDEPQYKRINCFHTDNIEVDFIKYLESKGIIFDDKIDLNGWLFINNESENDFVLNLDNKKLISNGGIILSKGNFRIKSDIKSYIIDDEKKYLTIITLGDNSNIVIDRSVEQLNASLVSKDGQVRLEGLGSDKFLEINGNVVMKKICKGEEGLIAMRRGVKLNYNNNLSAFPFKSTEEEKSTLMYYLADNPKVYKYE